MSSGTATNENGSLPATENTPLSTPNNQFITNFGGKLDVREDDLLTADVIEEMTDNYKAELFHPYCTHSKLPNKSLPIYLVYTIVNNYKIYSVRTTRKAVELLASEGLRDAPNYGGSPRVALIGCRPPMQSRILLDKTGIYKLSNSIFLSKLKYSCTNKDNAFDMNVFLAYLVRLEGLDHIIDEYCAYPDELLTPTSYTDFLGSINFDQNATTSDMATLVQSELLGFFGEQSGKVHSRQFTTEEACFMAVILLFSVNKTHQSPETFTAYLKARCKAFSLLMKFPGLDMNTIHTLFDYLAFHDLSSKIEFYPRFKQILFNAIILNNNQGWSGYVMEILKDSQLTTFNFIYTFLTEIAPTKALFYLKIATQVERYMVARKECERKYGALLPYAKLLNPYDSQMANTNWQELAALAVYGIYLETRSVSLKRFIFNVQVSNKIKTALAIKVKSEFWSDDHALTNQVSSEFLTFIGLSEGFDPLESSHFEAEIEEIKSALKDFDDHLTRNRRRLDEQPQ